MKQTLLTICLITFAFPSWGQTTFSGGIIIGGKITSNEAGSEQKLPKDWFTETPLNEKKDIYRGFNKFHKLVHCNFKECGDGYTPAEFITESNGNKFLALSARYGQLSKEFGDEDREFTNELQITIADNIKFSFEGVELWYGFRVKKPEKVDIQWRNIL